MHTVACDYSIDGAVNGDSKAQYFKIYNGKETLDPNIIHDDTKNEDVGVKWQGEGEGLSILYANVHKGLTMVAQWRWLQAFIPQVNSGSAYIDSDNGGMVEIASVADKSDVNYNATYNEKGGKSYHAETDEIITVKATPNTNYTFEGWYDAKGRQSLYGEFKLFEKSE